MKQGVKRRIVSAVACLVFAAIGAGAEVTTDPLNRTPAVEQAFDAFYAMDYDTALQHFERISQEHPQSPLATDFILDATIFKELNRLDLLDTTFYANDGFLTGKHVVVENPSVRDEVKGLVDKAVGQANALLVRNPNDLHALYARSWARSLLAAYTALAERSFPAALRLAISAKNDDQDVLRKDPNYIDANLVVGNYEYVVGALPLSFRLLIGVAGISGSKEKGMAMLEQAAAHGVRTSVEARTCMMLFLRREAKYGEAEKVAESLATQYPHDYLFQLEVANLQKDEGSASQAVAQYQRVLGEAQQPGYFHNAHLELAYFGLGDTLRGQKQYGPAAAAYRSAAFIATTSPELKQRCLLAAGKSYDLMRDHAKAVVNYQDAVDAGSNTAQGDEARKLIRHPFEGD